MLGEAVEWNQTINRPSSRKMRAMEIVKAQPTSYPVVRDFYNSLIDAMNAAGLIITWIKDVYPSLDFIKSSAEKGELYLCLEEDEIAAAMVLNHDCGEAYQEASWPTEAAESEVMVIHALGVHPKFGGKGIGAKMVEEAIHLARKEGQIAIRLDVLAGNEPARRIYVNCGFKSICNVQMYYENTGLADFELFELAL